MASGRFEYTIGFKTDDSGLKQARQALQEIQNLTMDSPGVTGVAENLSNAKVAASELEIALTKAFNVKMGTTSVAKLDQELKNLNRPLREIYEDIKSIGPAGEAAFNRVAAQALKTNLQIKQGNTILNKFGKTLWRNVEWLISGNLINTVTGVFTKAYGYTKNLDESLNNIRIVTGKGADEMARFGKEAQETAAKLGKGTTDITNASLIFYQQGLDKAEVDARTEVATKLANVSQQSAETTADQLTAVWNGFQAGTDDLEHYADVMTAIAANTASSSSELAGAISKVSSVAHTTGVDMEQLSAMISTVISVTRDSPETVGTAFKTIFARMDDLVEDGTDEFGVSLGRVSSHLAAMGIEILNEDGTLRDLGDTLTETGEKWKTYSREQQVAIAEQMGGKRQWNQVIALFDNWDKYKDALDVAKDSTGALQEQQDIYMESTQAHLQAVKTAWEGVYGEMMTADNINIVADTFTKVLNVVENFIKGVGGMGPIINALGATMLKAFSNQIAQNTLRISENVRTMFYNINEQKAQQSLTAQFGQLDSKLLKELSINHEKILRYQKDMTKEQQVEYEKLLDSRVETENKLTALEQQKKKLDEILAANKDINAAAAGGGRLTTENIGDIASAKAEIAQQVVDTRSVSLQSGREISLNMSAEDEKQTQGMIQMTQALDALIEARQKDKKALYEQIAAGKENNTLNSQKEAQLRAQIGAYDQVITEASKMQKAIYNFNGTEDGIKAVASAFLDVRAASQSANTEFSSIQQKLDDLTKNSGKTGLKDKLKIILGGTPDEVGIYKAKIQDITKALDEMGKSNTKIAALSAKYEELGKALDSLSSADGKAAMQSLANETRQAMGGVAEDMKTLMGGAADHIVQKFENAKAQVSAIKEQTQSFLKGLDFQHVVKTITSTTGAIGQLASGIQMINNLPSIWANMDISTGEKVTQTITSVSAALGILISSLSTLVPLITSGISAAIPVIAIAGAGKVAEEALIKAGNKRASVITTVDKLVKKNMLTEEAGNKIKADAIVAYEGETTAIMNETAAKEADAIATAALMAPLVALIAILAAVSAALFLSIEAYNKETESIKRKIEANKKVIESNNEIIEKSKKVQDAKSSWEELWSTYKDGMTITDEMKTSTVALIDTLEEGVDGPLHYAESLAQLTGDYSALNDEIERNLELERLKSNDAIQGNSTLVKYNVGASMLSEAREDASWTEKWSSSDNWFVSGFGNIAEYWGNVATNGYDIIKGFTGTTTQSQEARRERTSSLSTGIIAEGEDDQILKTYQKIYGKSNVWRESDGTITIDYDTSFKNESPQAITEAIVDERKQLNDYLGTLDTASDAYAQTLGRIRELDEKLKDYDEDIQNRKDKIVTGVAKSDLQGTYNFSKDLSIEELSREVARAKSEYSDIIRKQWIESGLDFTDEELENAVNNNFKNLYPTEKAIIAQGEQFLLNTKSAYKTYEDKITAYMNQNNWAGANSEILGRWISNTDEEKVSFSEQDFNKIKKSFQNTIKELTGNELTDELFNENYDLSLVEGSLLAKIIFGDATPEEFQQALNQAFVTPPNFQTFAMDLKGLGNDFENISKKINDGGINGNNVGESKDFAEMQSQLQTLLVMFPNNKELAEHIKLFNDTTKMGTQEYLKNLEWIQDYINNSPLKALNQESENIIEKWNLKQKNFDLTGTLVIDDGEFEEDLKKILDVDRQITVEVKANIDNDIAEMKTEFESFADAASKIGENFKISGDAIWEVKDIFQKVGVDITEGMQLMEDGNYQLNQAIVRNAIDAANAEIDIETEKAVHQIDETNKILEHKQEVYTRMLASAKELQDKNTFIDKDEAKNKEKLNEIITSFSNDQKDLELSNLTLMSLKEGEIQGEDLDQWKVYYDQLDDDAKRFWDGYVDRVNNALDGQKTDSQDWDFNDIHGTWNQYFTKRQKAIASEGETGGVQHGFTMWQDVTHEEDVEEIQSIGAQIQKWIEDQMAANQTAMDENNAERARILADAEWRKKYNDSLYTNILAKNSNTDATQDNTDATEDNAEAQQELLDLLNEEIDAYHDVTQQIERHTTALNRLQKAQEKATGKTLIKNLQDQMKAYQDLNNDYADKQLLQYEEAAVYRVQLEEQGVTFDENGVISNYSDILNQKQKEINADLSWYNSLSAEDQEAQKDWIESRQAEYDSLVDLIGNYDQLWNQDIPDLADEIAENIDKQVELELEIKKQIVQIEVDKGSLKRMEMELNKTLDNVQEKDLERNLAYNIQSYFTYSDEEKAKLKRYLEAKQKKDEADTSGEDLSAADLENYREALEDYNSIMQEKAKQANEIISSAFDGLNEKIERQKTQFETMSKLFEHDMNLIKLRYGDQAFEQLKTLYAAREENAKAQLSNANLALEVAQKELAAAQAKGDLDLVQAAQDKVTSALEAQRQAVIDNINAIQDTATNAVDAIFAHLDEQVAGVSFEKMKKQWDDMEKDSADYYDAINGAYEIEKLRTNMKKAINESGSAATQKALNNLMNEEITKLQQKDKLSKYDIERANALFDIEQKRAAFREAQNNKSKMRLRRDASGNYSYQFVSDEDKVTSAMQDLADAQNQLYNIDKEAYKNNLEKMQEYYLEYQEEMKAAANASAEERQAIEDRYMERIAELQEENGDISRNLIQDVVNDSEILTGKSIKNIEDMTQAEVDALMGSVIPAWESYLGIMSRSKDLLAEMKQAGLDASQIFDTSNAKIDIEMALSGLSWDSLIEGFDPAIENIKTMTSSTDEIAQEVKKISAGINQFIEAIKSNVFTEELKNFITALEGGTLIFPVRIDSAIDHSPKDNVYFALDNSNATIDTSLNRAGEMVVARAKRTGIEQEEDAIRGQLANIAVTFDTNGIIDNYIEIMRQKRLALDDDLNWYSSFNAKGQEEYRDWIMSQQEEYNNLFDLIDNYERAWNRDIPILIDEITKITEEKTDNVFQKQISDLIENSVFMSETVQFLADRISQVYSQQIEALDEVMGYLHTLNDFKEKEKELQEYQPTVVNINADFPAVTSQYEIEQALDSLVARATQRAYRTIR